MKSNPTAARRGFTLIEFMVIVAVFAVAALMVLPALRPPRINRAPRISCINNLKQVDLAYRQWAIDNNDNFPMEVSVTNGGAMEAALTGNVALVFQVMSNELNTPKILLCPADERRTWATTFEQTVPAHGSKGQIQFLSNSNVNYFVGLNPNETAPEMILSGDDNWLVGGKAGGDGVAIKGAPVKPGVVSLWTNTPVAWSEARHKKQGNVGLADGSVRVFSSSRLAEALRNSGVATNRLVFP